MRARGEALRRAGCDMRTRRVMSLCWLPPIGLRMTRCGEWSPRSDTYSPHPLAATAADPPPRALAGKRPQTRSSSAPQPAPLRSGSVTAKRAPPPSASAASRAPAVRGDDRRDDRQAEPGARAPAPAGRDRARQKRSNSSLGIVGRQARPVVADVERAPRRRARATDTSIGVPARRVDERVAHEVREHLAQLARVAVDDDRAVARVACSSISRSGATARASSTASPASAAQVDRLADLLADLVQAGEREQVLDEHAHPRRLVLDAGHRLLDVLGLARAAPIRNSSA